MNETQKLRSEVADLKNALETFARFAEHGVDQNGWVSTIGEERICDWFGPVDFVVAKEAFSRNGPDQSLKSDIIALSIVAADIMIFCLLMATTLTMAFYDRDGWWALLPLPFAAFSAWRAHTNFWSWRLAQ